MKPYNNEVEVYCEEYGWTVIQSRGQFGNPEDYFYRDWNQYQKGFGEPNKEQWLGLDNIYHLTNKNGGNQLKIVMEAFNGTTLEVNYGTFALANNVKYNLQVRQYDGPSGFDNLDFHNGYAFTTIDRDNDDATYNCAVKWKGGWWYRKCHNVNLNGWNFGMSSTPYAEGIIWLNFTTQYSSLKAVKMMVKPK